MISEKFGIGHILGLVLRRPDLAGDLPDQSREVQRPGGEKIDPGKQRETIFNTGKRDDVDVHNHLHRIVSDQGQRQTLLDLLPAEKPQGHQGSVDIEEQKEAEIIHEKKIQKYRDCDQQGHENRQVFFMDSAGRQGTPGKKTTVQFVVLEVVGNPKPEQKRKDRKSPDQLLKTEAESTDAAIQKDDKMNLSENDQAQGESWQDGVHLPEIDGQASAHERRLLFTIDIDIILPQFAGKWKRWKIRLSGYVFI